MLFGHALKAQKQGRVTDAVAFYRRHLALNPQAFSSLANLSWILATASEPALYRPDEALALARRSAELSAYKDPYSLNSLAAACAAKGEFALAVRHARVALALSEASGRRGLVDNLNLCLLLYESEKPYRESARNAAH
jgi:tetratricopeptide (TPR) repeat protein